MQRSWNGLRLYLQGETEEEIMKTAEEHAVRDHGYKPEDLMTPEIREEIRSHNKRY